MKKSEVRLNLGPHTSRINRQLEQEGWTISIKDEGYFLDRLKELRTLFQSAFVTRLEHDRIQNRIHARILEVATPYPKLPAERKDRQTRPWPFPTGNEPGPDPQPKLAWPFPTGNRPEPKEPPKAKPKKKTPTKAKKAEENVLPRVAAWPFPRDSKF